MSTQLTTKDLFGKKSIQERFEKILGDKAQGFISSVLQIVNSNNLLQNASPETVLNAAATAAVLNLEINPNLGYAWIVPYKGQAQFQMGWKGFVQLALRTGQYKNINVVEIHENQFKSFNALTENLDADFSIEGNGKIVGIASYLKLVTGFEKTVYWSMEKVKSHAKKYSKTYNKVNKSGQLIHSPWNDEDQFISMCLKTVLKNTISKWGIMSIEMQTAQLADQSVQSEQGKYDYIDSSDTIDIENIIELEEKEIKLIKGKIAACIKLEDLNIIYNSDLRIKTNEELVSLLKEKRLNLTEKES